MRIEIKSFRTRLGRRIFLLFVICAVVPIMVLALISFSHVKKQLNEQSEKRLRQESKAVAVSIYERLSLLKGELRLAASNAKSSFSDPPVAQADIFTQNLRERFVSLSIIAEGRTQKHLMGHVQVPSGFTAREKYHMASGKVLLSRLTRPDRPPIIFMAVAFDPTHPERGVLVGIVNRHYLWRTVEGRPPITELCVLDQSNNILFASAEELASMRPFLSRQMDPSRRGQFEWSYQGKTYFASYSSIFLESNFLSSEWVVVLTEPKDAVLAPMAHFTKSFPFIVMFTLGLVVLFSIILIRKNLVPIEILRQATQKIAEGDLGHQVEIRSGDEFESLGKSFNEMRKKLKEGQTLLVRAAKMSTMGQMAAGIVHEIKQPLTPIYGLLELSLMEELPAKGRKNLQAALEAVERLNGILGRFRSFSFTSPETVEKLSVKQAIDQVYRLLEHQFTMNNTRCITEIDEDLPSILADNQGLQQVFSNLLINALHALENKNNGQRTIKIRAYSSKATVSVEVEDNGCGITQKIQERIFDPFFTTKGTDKGTGLGMAIVESILHSHHAEIEIESEVGVGTRFTIVFPAASQNNH